jgi:hypothetical protein
VVRFTPEETAPGTHWIGGWGIFPLYGEITEYKDRWNIYLERIELTRIQLQAYEYRPSGRRDIGRPRGRWKETILEAGTGDAPNPGKYRVLLMRGNYL